MSSRRTALVIAWGAVALMFGCGRGPETAAPPSAVPAISEATPPPYDTYGTSPEVASAEAQATVAIMFRLGSAVEAYQDEAEYPEVSRVEELRPYLVPDYLDDLPLVDGWGRPFELAMVDTLLEIRSLGADGVRDDHPGQGAVADPNADIVYRGEDFQQWPAGTR